MQSQLPTSGSVFPDRVLTEDGDCEYALIGVDNAGKAHYWPDSDERSLVYRVDEDFEDVVGSGFSTGDNLDLYMLGWHWDSVADYALIRG
jgi:hypothetical protein